MIGSVISLFENHDDAYFVWRKAKAQDRILVHLDAHDDIGWAPSSEALNIGNFLCLGLKDGFFHSIFWVVPRDVMQTRRGQKQLAKRLREVLSKYPGGCPRLAIQKNSIIINVLGKPLQICTLDHLPPFNEKILLDLDVDYMVTSCDAQDENLTSELPWCWPSDLVGNLRSIPLSADLVTISYSVEGGFTPLKWKYLGDDLAARLSWGDQNHPALTGLDAMRDAALAAHRGAFEEAERNYLVARDLLPRSAAPFFHLAHLYADTGRINEAQSCYQEARVLDPSYSTPYNSAGLRHFWGGRLLKAEQEHRRMLIMNSEDAYAHFGLGQLAAQQRRWSDAEVWLCRALELKPALIDAYRILGEVLARQNRVQEAVQALENSLKLTLKGHRPLNWCIATHAGAGQLNDPDFFTTFGRLGRLHAYQGNIPQAIADCQMALAGGCNGFLLRSRLSHLFLKERRWREAAREAWQAVRQVPVSLVNQVCLYGRYIYHRLWQRGKG
jgi:tetratricopeptide (TPR) repeat protein